MKRKELRGAILVSDGADPRSGNTATHTAAYCSILEVFAILRCERLKRSKGDNAWNVCKAEFTLLLTATLCTVDKKDDRDG